MKTQTKLSQTENPLKKIEAVLPKTLSAERHMLKLELIRIRRFAKAESCSEKTRKKLFHLDKQVRASVRKKTLRKKNLPRVTYNEALPITARKDEIISAIAENQVVIISGETGSGKTTQIPKCCIEAGRGIDGRIGCTQPRRIAATTVARRIAEELGEEPGKSVGYKIRFQDHGGEHSYIKIMTDGILLAEAQNDPWLNEYDTIIVDEAHERSLNIDFVLGILKTLLKKRKNLKLIITSATIDTEKFSKAFDNAPITEVSGRMYPVDVRYYNETRNGKNAENEEQSHTEMAVHAVRGLLRESRHGDILVFMPTEQDIRETCELMEEDVRNSGFGIRNSKFEIMPLFARLSGAEQTRVFSSVPGRKIIVATNVAETSVTIPGIRYVVDTGLARILQYMPRSRTTALPVIPVSQSSADQRKGRCGRVQNGICVRLFSEEDFLSRPLFTPPEILRSNLAEVILRMISLKLGDISDFPFIDKPAAKNIKDGFDLLVELGAIKRQTTGTGSRFSLTGKGRVMAKIPLDPRLSGMLIEAQTENCLEEITVIASALSIQDPRERPSEKQAQADQAHAVFKDRASDFITLLNIWNAYHSTWQSAKSNNKLKKFCAESFLSFRRMREWRDIHRQIRAILEETGNLGLETGNSARKSDNRRSATGDLQPATNNKYADIHKAILSGFLSNIAMRKDKNIFQATKGKEVMIFPGSGLFNKPGPWIVAAEMVETSRLFARTVACIDADWLEALGGDQCKYTYSEPHWERSRGEVVASEQVSLFGLVIVPGRAVSYGRISSDEANDIFIQSALIEGDVRHPFPFMRHNQKLIDEVRDMENKIRRRDLLVSEQDMFQFYKEKLDGVHNIRTLQSRLKKKGSDEFLRMRTEDLFLYDPNKKEIELYPDRITVGEKKLECAYSFEPGKQDDGVTVRISSAIAPSVPADSLDWLVPGLLNEKVTTLIRGLPKACRRRLVPIGDTVGLILREMPEMREIRNLRSERQNTAGLRLPDTALITALNNFIYRRFGVDIPASAWPLNTLPDHLRMRISITGPGGEEICSGRDRHILSKNVSEKADPDALETARKKWEKEDIAKWDFGDLPDTLTINGHRGNKWLVYPGLETDDRRICLKLFQDRDKALDSHRKGVEKLFFLHFSKELKSLKRSLALSGESKSHAEYFGGPKTFEKGLYESILHDLFCKNIRTEKAFYDHVASAAPTMHTYTREKLGTAVTVLRACHETRSVFCELETNNRANPVATTFLRDLRAEFSRLVPETFMALYDTERMIHLERYVRAIGIRAQRGLVNFEKDQTKAKEVGIHSERLNQMLKALSAFVSLKKRKAVEEYFWLIEEFKVSLFAQELKTPVPVSKKRLDRKAEEIGRMA